MQTKILMVILLSFLNELIEATDRRRKPPPRRPNTGRNEIETFYSKVMSSHVRYCTDGRVCENRRAKTCYICDECFCDEACFYYNDCCPDLALKQPTAHPEEFDCKSPLVEGLYPKDVLQTKLKTEPKYNMITTCPSDNSFLRNGCWNSTVQPVTGTNNITTFKNTFCALCHNVTQIREWKILIQCTTFPRDQFSDTAELLEVVRHDVNCTVKYAAPEGVVERQCTSDRDTISQCNVTGLWSQYDAFVERACGSYQTIKSVANQTYRNPFCFICNTDQPDLLFTQSPCKRSSGIVTPSFTALLDFSDLLHDRGDVTISRSRCSKGNIYDSNTAVCRTISCAFGRELKNNSCVSMLGRSRGAAYRLYFSLSLDEEIPLRGPEDLLEDLPASLENYFKYNLFDMKASLHGVIFAYNTTSEFGNCSDFTSQIFFSANLVTVKDVDQNQFEKQLLAFRNVSFHLFNGIRNFNFSTSISDVAQTFVPGHQHETQASCMVTRKVTYGNPEQLVYTSVNGLLLCPRIILEASEFQIMKDSGLFVDWKPELIPFDNFEVLNDGRVLICLKDFKPEAQEILDGRGRASRSASFAESLVSMICTSVSLICLLLSFVVYCVFKSMRSLPGKNNMNLIATLFWAQFFYLVGAGRTEITGVCQAMGMCIHYFWLAAFCAMNVCSFHMFRVFTSMRSRDATDLRRRFLQYSAYIYGMPAVVEAITLISHLVATDGESIGYGGRICYLSSHLAIGAAFGIPVALTIISNSIFFIVTLRAIRNTPKIDKNKEDENHAAVYIKLSTLTGVTWTLGFLAILSGIQAMSFVFILVNASQGVFLFISFVCNDRVKKLIQDKRSETSSSHSRTGTGRSNTAVTTLSVTTAHRITHK